MKLRVLVADDSAFVRRVLKQWINAESDMEVVSEATDGNQAVQLVAEIKPDVVALDFEMPYCDGITALRRIRAHSSVPVLMVGCSKHGNQHQICEAMEAGAFDCALKPERCTDDAIQTELITKLRLAKWLHEPGSSYKPSAAIWMTS